MSERRGRFESLEGAATGSVRRWQAPSLGPGVVTRAIPVRVDAGSADGGRPAASAASEGASARTAEEPTPARAAAPAAPDRSSEGSSALPETSAGEALLQRRFEEGRACGLAEGEAAGRAALENAAGLVATLARERSRREALLEEELLALARAMARLILRRELEHDAETMHGLVRAALEELPRIAEEPVVRLHPLDAAALRERLGSGEGAIVMADATLARGDCRIESGPSVVDAGIDAWVDRVAVGQELSGSAGQAAA